MIVNLLYKQKKKKYSMHFDHEDIVVDNIVINPVHIVPQCHWKPKQEIDFYMDDGLDIYFLRIINSNECKITIIDDSKLRYIILYVPIESTYDLRRIIKKLSEFPYNQKTTQKEKTCRFEI